MSDMLKVKVRLAVAGSKAASCSKALTPDGFGAQIYAEADAGKISHDEAALLVRSLLTAGLDTTIFGLGNALLCFARNPEQWQALRENPSLLRSAFEEVLRYASPVQTFLRTTNRDVEVEGVPIPEGSKVLLFLASANRDPRKWEDPDRFDIQRKTIGHVGFGYGIHVCVGQMVARLEAELLLGALARRVESLELHDEIQEGDRLRISAPRNLFPLATSPRRSLLLAGGIGVTPLLSMVHQLARQNSDFELHYCRRSQARAAFHRQLREAPFGDRVSFHFDDGPASQRLDVPALLVAPAPDLDLYVCGPGGFLEYVLTTARERGWDEARLHYESFSAKVEPGETDAPFEVRLASSGQVYPVAPGQTVVTALAAQGVEIPVSCEQGICGSCLTRVLKGEPEHRDQYLTPAEQALNDQFTPCCSRSKSPLLVLDL